MIRRPPPIGRALLLTAAAAFVGAALILSPTGDLPAYEDVVAAWRPSDAWLLDRHGEVLSSRRIDLAARRLPWTRLEDVSPRLLEDVLAVEDRRFFEHGGVDVVALAAAARDNIRRGMSGRRLRGASTITMQLAALLDPSLRSEGGGRSLVAKWRQMVRARALERSWSKDRILEAYLNLAPFRGETIGVAAASRALFDKAPSGLDRAEARLLAASLGAPGAPLRTVAKRACLLAPKSGTIDCAALARLADTVSASPSRGNASPDLAPHLAAHLLEVPGGRLSTTLDAAAQRLAVDALRRRLLEIGDRGVGDGAVVVLDNASGEVLAYVGSSGALSSAPFVDGVVAPRQAGSTLKPFLYALAIERGLLTAGAILDDAPVNVATPLGLYAPRDYDSEFRGPVSVRTALASSLNVPAVRALALVGAEPFLQKLRGLGFEGLREDGDYYGLGLALGGADVRLIDLANAYRTLANGGMTSPIRIHPGTTAGHPARRVISQAASFVVTDILSDSDARASTFGLSSPLDPGAWAAVKTGTSKDMRDNWCVGFTRAHTVAVWVGNFSGASMRDVSGTTGAAPVWRDIVRQLADASPSTPPAVPAGVVASDIRYLPPIEPARREWFVAGTETREFRLAGESDARPMRLGRIVYPAEDTVLALDPDIPDTHQRVVFRAEARPGVRWTLDGALVGGGARVNWRLQPGTHRLELIDDRGARLDAVRFQVRGARPR